MLEPDLSTSSNNTNDESGLYKSTATNTGDATYYFRGNVENNYISFAGFTWRIVRINEDGTIRIIMQDGINNNTSYQFNSSSNNYAYMYYTNSNIKDVLENWYDVNIGNYNSYASKIMMGEYFCEQAKVKYMGYTSNTSMIEYSSYLPNFKCNTDANEKGIINSNIGLLTYDEVVYAGGYYNENNVFYYLNNSNIYWWTMSPSGCNYGYSYEWFINPNSSIQTNGIDNVYCIRPVLNLKTDTQAIGNGTSSKPYVVIN